jgi:hypothetical protein
VADLMRHEVGGRGSVEYNDKEGQISCAHVPDICYQAGLASLDPPPTKENCLPENIRKNEVRKPHAAGGGSRPAGAHHRGGGACVA